MAEKGKERTDSERLDALSTMAEISYRSVGGTQTVRGYEEDCSAEWWEASDGEARFQGETLRDLADDILEAEDNAAAVVAEALPGKVIDLMEALKESLSRSKPEAD